jgi:hypothetical protein
VHKDVEMQVTKQCKIRFVIHENCIDEVQVDVVPLEICGVLLRNPYMYYRKAIFSREENKYCPIKYGKSYIIHAHKGENKIPMEIANQDKRLVNVSKKFVLLL